MLGKTQGFLAWNPARGGPRSRRRCREAGCWGQPGHVWLVSSRQAWAGGGGTRDESTEGAKAGGDLGERSGERPFLSCGDGILGPRGKDREPRQAGDVRSRLCAGLSAVPDPCVATA